MKRQSPHSKRAGFTLVEMLVVIAIIGILAGLTVPAVLRALKHAKAAAVAVEINQLDMACKAYKEKLGEYPPDFAGVNFGNAIVRTPAQNAILRHLAKAFPRYQPGISTIGVGNLTGWLGLRADILGSPQCPQCVTGYVGWGLDIRRLTPAGALTFFLGGKPEWRLKSDGVTLILPGDTSAEPFDPNTPVRGFLGFSANPLNPFDNSPSRIRPFYEFDLASLRCFVDTSGTLQSGMVYWPKDLKVTDKANTGPIVYFRAENGNYTVDGGVVNFVNYAQTAVTIKNQDNLLFPAIDTRLCGVMNPGPPRIPNSFTWMNPSTFQIFSSGLDLKYAALLPAGPVCCLAFPTGENYQDHDPTTGGSTFDDITNFSGATLESAIP
jgi:type II secretion system protein G